MSRRYFGLILIAAALFLAWVFDMGTFDKISALRTAIQEREGLVADRKKILEDLRKFKAEFTKHAGDARRFSAVVPSEKEIAELIAALEAIASQTGLTLSSIATVENAGQGEGYQNLSVAIEGQGTYPTLVSFLSALESNIRLLDVQSVEVATDQSRPSQLSIKMQASAYFLK